MNILIADDLTIMRAYLRASCCDDKCHTVVGEAIDGLETIELVDTKRPDIIILELQLPKMTGIEVIAALKTKKTRCKILVYTSHHDHFTIYRLEKLGVNGYVSKREAFTEVRNALEDLAAGRSHFSAVFQSVRRARRQNSNSFDKLLSSREMEVLSHVGDLMTDQQIACALFTGISNVVKHRSNIARKLGTTSRVELERFAVQNGFCQNVPIPRAGYEPPPFAPRRETGASTP